MWRSRNPRTCVCTWLLLRRYTLRRRQRRRTGIGGGSFRIFAGEFPERFTEHSTTYSHSETLRKPVETYGSCKFAGARNPRHAGLECNSSDFPVIFQHARNDLIRHRRSGGDLPFNTRGIVIDLPRICRRDCECVRCCIPQDHLRY